MIAGGPGWEGLGDLVAKAASRTAAVSSPELRFAGPGGFAIRSADEPVVGLHHRVGEEHLPLDGADREPGSNCLSQTNRVTPSAVSSGQMLEVTPKPGGTRTAMRASIVD